MPGSRPKPVAPRLALRSRREGDCVVWTGTTGRGGYGAISVEGKMRSVHRVAWELHNGRPAPVDLDVLHSCDNPPCINPAHLSLGTHLDNMRDRDAKGRGGGGQPGGQDHPSAKLGDAQVGDIRTRFHRGEGKWELARAYGVSWSCINLIVTGRRRNKVPLSRAAGFDGRGESASV